MHVEKAMIGLWIHQNVWLTRQKEASSIQKNSKTRRQVLRLFENSCKGPLNSVLNGPRMCWGSPKIDTYSLRPSFSFGQWIRSLEKYQKLCKKLIKPCANLFDFSSFKHGKVFFSFKQLTAPPTTHRRLRSLPHWAPPRFPSAAPERQPKGSRDLATLRVGFFQISWSPLGMAKRKKDQKEPAN